MNIKLGKELVAFGLVGVGAAAVHYLTALLLHQRLGFSVQESYFVGFFTGFILSYLGQSLLTFRSGLSIKSLAKYVLLAIANYLLSALILWVLDEVIGILPEIAMLAVILTVPIISFLISKFYIFKV